MARVRAPHPSRRVLRRPLPLLLGALLVLPLSAGPAAAAPPPGPAEAQQLRDQLRAARAEARDRSARLLAVARGEGGLPRLADSGPVSVVLQLEARPAVSAYRSALRGGRAAAAAASRETTAAARGVADRVIARLDEPATRATVLYRTTKVYAGVAVSTDRSRLAALRALPGVAAVRPLVPKERSNAVSVPTIGAPTSWQTGPAGTGAGIRIGIIDSGLDFTHADFGGPGTTEAYRAADAADTRPPAAGSYDPSKYGGGVDFAGDDYTGSNAPRPDPNPLDCDGHGTHVAGTAAGYGVTGDGATYRGPYGTGTEFERFRLGGPQAGIGPGVAPGAVLYGLRVFGCEGSTNLVTPALDWAADPDGDGDVSDHLDVVNMSLGSDFGTPDDPDAVSTDAASLLGISVVASAGNSGDTTGVSGTPASAVRAISVAAADDGWGIFDGLRIDAPAGIGPATGPQAGLVPAQRSIAYDWAARGGLTSSTPVAVTSTDWAPDRVGTTNADGCAPFTPAQAAAVRGQVALLLWLDDDAVRRCGSVGRSANARAAGAVAAIFASDADGFSAGITGDATIPVMITVRGPGEAMRAAVAAGTEVRVRLQHADRNSTTIEDPSAVDTPARFTSRGRVGRSGLKPDVTGFGVSTFSAANGTGSEGVAESGTSMSAPEVAGVAALVRARHRGWTPEQVKAAILGTASSDVRTPDGRLVYGPPRVGSGRVRADRAAAAEVLALSTARPGAVSADFGVVQVPIAGGAFARSVPVQVTNASSTARTLTPSFRAIHAVPGVQFSVSPASVSLGAGESASLTVTMRVPDPAALRRSIDPTMERVDPTSGLPRQFLTEATGLVVLSQGGVEQVRVAVAAAVRPASSMTASAPSTFPEGRRVTTPLVLRGAPLLSGPDPSTGYTSLVTALQAAATSGRLPACGGGQGRDCVPFPSVAALDIAAVGVGSDAPGVRAAGDDPFAPATSSFTYFGVQAQAEWEETSADTQYTVWIDRDRDGRPDFATYDTRLATGGGDATDVPVAVTQAVDADGDLGDVVDVQPLNLVARPDTGVFDTSAMVLPVANAALGLRLGASRFDWWVESTSAYGGSDEVASAQRRLTFDAAVPALRVTDDPGGADVPYVTFLDAPTAADYQLRLVKDAKAYRIDRPLGLWLFHHHNATGRTQVLSVRQAQRILVPGPDRRTRSARDGRFRLTASATSGLPVRAVSETPAVCRVSGTSPGAVVTPRAAGNCLIRLSQPGDAEYLPAASVALRFRVNGATRTRLTVPDRTLTRSQDVRLTARVAPTAPSPRGLTGRVVFYAGRTSLGSAAVDRGRAAVTWRSRARGTYAVRAEFRSSTSWYTGSSSATVTVRVR